MARYPEAEWRPLPENTTQPAIAPRVIIVHSAVTRGGAPSLYPYFARPDVGLESHFYVTMTGGVEQYVDTGRRADANYKANNFAISIETEDLGDPDNEPWTAAQLDALVRLIRWCCDTHQIPKVLATAWDGHGIGYHTQFGSPSPWTPVVKTCPGRDRVAQFAGLLFRVAAQPSTAVEVPVEYTYPSGVSVDLNPPPRWQLTVGACVLGIAQNGNLYAMGPDLARTILEDAIAASGYVAAFVDRQVAEDPSWDGHYVHIRSTAGEAYDIPVVFPAPPQTVDPAIIARAARCGEALDEIIAIATSVRQ